MYRCTVLYCPVYSDVIIPAVHLSLSGANVSVIHPMIDPSSVNTTQAIYLSCIGCCFVGLVGCSRIRPMRRRRRLKGQVAATAGSCTGTRHVQYEMIGSR